MASEEDEAISFKNPQYQFKIFQSKPNEAYNPWPKLAYQTSVWIEQNGLTNDYLVTAYNRSEGDMAVIYVISWSNEVSDYFKSKQRPAECCSDCMLF